MSLQNAAEEYFSKINPIAKRLYADINDTKVAYDKLWSSLSADERDQIVNESIIKPEAYLKYHSITSERHTSPKFASKLIIEDNCSYRDEHSAPFSFRTPSQRDLRLFGDMEKPHVVASYSEPKVDISINNVKREESSDSCDINELSPVTNTTSISTLPKTGLDLLDNW